MRYGSFPLEDNLAFFELKLMRGAHIPDQSILAANGPASMETRVHCKGGSFELLAVEFFGVVVLEVVIYGEEDAV